MYFHDYGLLSLFQCVFFNFQNRSRKNLQLLSLCRDTVGAIGIIASPSLCHECRAVLLEYQDSLYGVA